MKTALDSSILVVNIAMMVAVGMDLGLRHFVHVVRQKRTLPAALIGQAVLLPIFGWSIAHSLPFPSHVRAGLLLLAACPVGSMANFYAALARADAALSVVVSTLSCLLAAVTMAACFELFGRLVGEPFLFAAPPLQLVGRLMLLTAVPIAAGMGLRRLLPRLVARIVPAVRLACLVGLAEVIALVVVVQADRIAAEWKPAAAASLALMVAAMAAGWVLSRAVGLADAERVTFAIVFPVRNVALALTVAVTLAGRVEYAAFALVYFLAQVPLLLGIVALHRWRRV